MNRTYFAALLAWILCALIVMASAPWIAAPLVAMQPTPAASRTSATVLRFTPLLPLADARPPAPTTVRGSTADMSSADVPAVVPGSSSFDLVLNSGRLARFSH